jgi:hypothetical protein
MSRILVFKDEGTAVPRNVGQYSPKDVASHPTSLEDAVGNVLCAFASTSVDDLFRSHSVAA